MSTGLLPGLLQARFAGKNIAPLTIVGRNNSKSSFWKNVQYTSTYVNGSNQAAAIAGWDWETLKPHSRDPNTSVVEDGGEMTRLFTYRRYKSRRSEEITYPRFLRPEDKAPAVELQAISMEDDHPESPWRYVICETEPKYVLSTMHSIKDKVTADTVILFVHRGGGMGLLDAVFREVWPNPSTRPTFVPAFCRAQMYNSNTNQADDPKEYLSRTNYGVEYDAAERFTTRILDEGHMVYGHVVDYHENSDVRKYREGRALDLRILIERLYKGRYLRGTYFERELGLRSFAASILQPLAILGECYIGHIFTRHNAEVDRCTAFATDLIPEAQRILAAERVFLRDMGAREISIQGPREQARHYWYYVRRPRRWAAVKYGVDCRALRPAR